MQKPINENDLEYLESLYEKEPDFKEQNNKKIRACW